MLRALEPGPHESHRTRSLEMTGADSGRGVTVSLPVDAILLRRSAITWRVLIRNLRHEAIGAGSDPRVGSELLGYRLRALLGRRRDGRRLQGARPAAQGARVALKLLAP